LVVFCLLNSLELHILASPCIHAQQQSVPPGCGERARPGSEDRSVGMQSNHQGERHIWWTVLNSENRTCLATYMSPGCDIVNTLCDVHVHVYVLVHVYAAWRKGATFTQPQPIKGLLRGFEVPACTTRLCNNDTVDSRGWMDACRGSVRQLRIFVTPMLRFLCI
jgi:hypothetical protein